MSSRWIGSVEGEVDAAANWLALGHALVDVGEGVRKLRRSERGAAVKNRIAVEIEADYFDGTIGMTFQQFHKYEKATNLITASRLFEVSKALGVDVGVFFQPN